MEKDAQKLQLIKDTQELWDQFQDVHNNVYSVKLILGSLIHMKEDIKLQVMPPMLYKYCKLRGTFDMVTVLNSNLAIIKEDTLSIQQSIGIVEGIFGLEKKDIHIAKFR